MNEHTYFTIGLYLSLACVSLWLIPLYYFIALKASDFITDKKYESYSDKPEERTQEKFYVHEGYISIHTLLGLLIFIVVLLLWPIAVFVASIIGVLFFLRMSSRLKRHVADKKAHE